MSTYLSNNRDSPHTPGNWHLPTNQSLTSELLSSDSRSRWILAYPLHQMVWSLRFWGCLVNLITGQRLY